MEQEKKNLSGLLEECSESLEDWFDKMLEKRKTYREKMIINDGGKINYMERKDGAPPFLINHMSAGISILNREDIYFIVGKLQETFKDKYSFSVNADKEGKYIEYTVSRK